LLFVLDGIDAVGKSTICQNISEARPVANIGEFSDSPIGEVITEIIEEKRFFTLSEDFASPLADLFLILSDTCLKYEGSSDLVKSTDKVACIMDRGIFSAVAYQFARASEFYDAGELEVLHDAVLDLSLLRSSAISSAKHINLVLNETTLISRIKARGETRLDSKQLQKLLEIQDWMVRLSHSYNATIIDVSELSFEQVNARIAGELDVLINEIEPPLDSRS